MLGTPRTEVAPAAGTQRRRAAGRGHWAGQTPRGTHATPPTSQSHPRPSEPPSGPEPTPPASPDDHEPHDPRPARAAPRSRAQRPGAPSTPARTAEPPNVLHVPAAWWPASLPSGRGLGSHRCGSRSRRCPSRLPQAQGAAASAVRARPAWFGRRARGTPEAPPRRTRPRAFAVNGGAGWGAPVSSRPPSRPSCKES